MDEITAKKRIEELSEELYQYNKEYYVLDSPSIDDYTYDMKMNELKKLEKEFPQYLSPDSPTQKVGGFAVNTFAEVKHSVQMASLQDVFSFDEVEAYFERCNNSIGTSLFVVEPKIDGLSVSLEYKDGEFIRGSTRGDGFVGEDVTANLRTIRSVPKKLNQNIPYLEVRGEVYMSRDSFEELVKQQEINDEKPAKNPRNAAAGSLRQKNSKN